MISTIPAPAADPALPGLAALLDAEAVAGLLQNELPDMACGAMAIERCRPVYVRYKPGTSCLVAYELSIRDRATGATASTAGHIRVFADDRARRRLAKPSFAHLLEEAARLHPGPPARRAAYLPTVNGLALLYPVDPTLQTLVQAMSPEVVRRVMAGSMAETAALLTDEPPTTIRYKPERKALLRYRLNDGTLGSIYGKLHDDERGHLLVKTGTTLLRAGVTTARPLTYLPDLRLLLHAEAPGHPLSDLLHRDPDGMTDWMEPLGAALARLHATTCPELPAHGLDREAAAVAATARMIGAVRPQLAHRAEDLAGALATRLATIPARWATTHGDFYHDQALVGGPEGVVLIDLDEARQAHPLLDVANFLAQLIASAPDRDATQPAAVAFRDAYLRRCSEGATALPIFEAAALLRLAIGPFRRLEPDWPRGIEERLDLAEARLEEGRRLDRAAHSTAVDSRPLGDPALPQLTALTDRSRLRAALEGSVFAAPVDVREIDIVRHKPGRRAILRYDLVVGPPGIEIERQARLYGKIFASDRGPRVYDVTRRIVAARAFGPAVRLPEPVAYLPELKLLLQREVAGEPVADRLLAGDVELAERAADAISALHASGIDLGRRHDLARELDPLHDRVERLVAIDPTMTEPAWSCLALVAAGRQRTWTWHWQPIHRDFYHDQLLVDPGRPDDLAVLDLDDAALSEPAVDVANFAAHLTLLALQVTGDPDGLAAVAGAFVRRCFELAPHLDPDLVLFLQGATLLRLAEIHAPRHDGRRIAGSLLAASERTLKAIVAQPDGTAATREAARGTGCAA